MLNGYNIIGKKESALGSETFEAYNPLKQSRIKPPFYQATTKEVKEAVELAWSGFESYRNTSPLKRAEFLKLLATLLEEKKATIIARCIEETALPEQRLLGEMTRTVNQIKMFAELLKDGFYCNVKIDTAIPDRTPVPKPDLRQMLIPVGPVAVFGASNFPLAFSVAGGDTISALASGCSVVVKAHPLHPGTSELVAKVILQAVKQLDLSDGVFSMLQGKDNKIGELLVKSEKIKAVAFTGSQTGGKALFDIAVRRDEPIPVYAEMGSVNPVIVLPKALKERGKEIVKGIATSVTLGAGQFCTNPGVIFVLKSNETNLFFENLKGEFKKIKPGTMLSETIAKMYKQKINNMKKHTNVLIAGENTEKTTEGQSYIFYSEGSKFNNNKTLQQEVFGPSTIIVIAEDKHQLKQMLSNLEGQLTITFHGTNNELQENSSLIDIAKEKAGRLILNGFPTGVEVCHSMHHGGPYPATTDVKSTSVGTESIKRFLKPICFQGFPDSLLPQQLKNSNPLNILRLVNETYTKETI